MTNIEQFDLLTGILLGDLYTSFPVAIDARTDAYLEQVVPPEDGEAAFNFVQVFTSTVRWLDQYGYIHIEHDYSTLDCYEFKVSLSEKGLHTLRKLPKSLQSEDKASIGDMFARGAKRLADGVATKLVMDAVDFGIQAGIERI
ncbi:hypothetical protein [Pseudidiomarina sp.]|uniref:hypothetical protein n=1 Tax=Pseudidiomarina sp. TaxID=2081707 RepID=UPI003A982232